MVLASELRAGMALRIEGHVYKVVEAEAKAGAAKLGGVVKSKLRDVASGRLWEPHFRPDERLEDLELSRRSLEFLYAEAGHSTFMDPQNFEQVEVPAALIGDAEQFLQPGTLLPVEFYGEQPISVVLPDTADARITETAPPAHSGQDSTWKPATLENGVRIQVPLFIAPGEVVRVDLRSLRYLERARVPHKKGA